MVSRSGHYANNRDWCCRVARVIKSQRRFTLDTSDGSAGDNHIDMHYIFDVQYILEECCLHSPLLPLENRAAQLIAH